MAQDRRNGNGSIGVVIFSHCRIAQEMLRTVELIAGPLEGWKALSTEPWRPVGEVMEELRALVREASQGRGVLIFTDLVGGTPANLSLACLESGVEVICGMNLPMLIKVAQSQEQCGLSEMAEMAKEYGRRHIFLASQSLHPRS